MLQRLTIAVAVAASSAAGWSQAADRSAQDWLAQMSDAVRTQNYEGVVVYRTGDQLETMRVIHRFADGQEDERLISLTGDAREIVRRDGEVRCLLPRERVVMIDERGQSALLPKVSTVGLETLGAHYEFARGVVDRVADRACQGVQLSPRDAYRFGYQLCIDVLTGVPLRIALLNGEGDSLEQFLFTSVGYPESIVDQALEPAIDTQGFREIRHGGLQSAPTAAEQAAFWEVTDVPPGFRVVGQSTRLFPGASTPVTHSLLTDGLATVSVFAAENKLPAKVFRGVSSIGAVHAYGRMVDDHHVAVVGEVPARTVEQIGNSLRRTTDSP